MPLGFSQKGFIGFCDVLVERPELQDGFPFHEGSPLVKRCGIMILIVSKYAKIVKHKKVVSGAGDCYLQTIMVRGR